MECPLRFNDTTIRKRIANWINEECGASLNCGLKEQLDKDHVVIGHFECEEEKNELRLVALLNGSQGLTQDNVLPAHLLGLVLQSREHLLSFLLHSEILAATVHRRLKGRSMLLTWLETPRNSSIKNGHQQYCATSGRCSSRIHPADTIVNLFFSSLRELGSYSKGGMAP
ncbi:hypothetical protein ANCCAN_13976 [Ancylostoma caninum]|uniref:Uncharacterized protein n=1 Tax=Ancylostoma caninum TaxID=29170 RepID=A0A368G6N3_ANCCA|nr:hypothetical protein ANCCAN_13976 [Ancylostoma caninum]